MPYTNTNLYRKYLVMDRISKLLEKSERVELSGIHLSKTAESWKKDFFEPEPDTYLYGEIKLSVNFVGLTYSMEDDVAQEYREKATVEMLDLIPGSFLTRSSGGYVTLGAVLNDVTVSISIGQAFCQKVEVGTKTVMKPIGDVPMEEVEEPIYEYRCNDDILGAMPQAVSAS